MGRSNHRAHTHWHPHDASYINLLRESRMQSEMLGRSDVIKKNIQRLENQVYKPPRSMAERLISNALDRMPQITAIHRQIDIPITLSGSYRTYMPTFILPYHYIDGRMMIIETHREDHTHAEFLRRLKAARRQYPVYIVFVKPQDIGHETTITDGKILRNVDELLNIWDTRPIQRHVKEILGKAEISQNNGIHDMMRLIRAGAASDIRN